MILQMYNPVIKLAQVRQLEYFLSVSSERGIKEGERLPES